MSAPVGLVVVSHSVKLAEGVAELAAQMAPDVTIGTAGGTDDGRIGTSFDKVGAAIAEADRGAGVVVLCDLGSAFLTAETALDFLDDDTRERVRISHAPLVGGAVAGAVRAQTGGDLAEVLEATLTAGAADQQAEPDAPASAPSTGAAERTLTLTNDDGLHARPAAALVKLVSGLDAGVTVNGVNAKSLLAIMALGLTKGQQVTIASDDTPAGAEAVAAVAALIESGFDE